VGNDFLSPFKWIKNLLKRKGRKGSFKKKEGYLLKCVF